MYAFSKVKNIADESSATLSGRIVFGMFPFFRGTCRLFALLAVISGVIEICGPVVFGQDFRIENEVTHGKSEKPVRSLSIFHGDTIYDFIEPNGEITILDEKNGRFLFVHPRLRISSSLETAQCRKEVDEFRANAPKTIVDFSSFARNPSFAVSADRDSGEMLFKSKWIEYKIETKALENAKVAERYYRFSEWFCYLNTSIHPQAATQMARLEVNKELQKSGRFPEKLTVITYPKGNVGMFPSSETAHCRSTLSVRLLENDLKRIAAAGELLRTFRSISFDDYQEEIIRDAKSQEK